MRKFAAALPGRLPPPLGVMLDRCSLFLLIWPLATCVIAASTAETDQPPCRLAALEIVKGMPRMSVEQQVGSALGLSTTYSPFANNLAGGTVTYEDEGCTLTVTYERGAPAPMTRTADGQTQHLPPHDEEVLTVDLVRNAIAVRKSGE